MHPDAPVQATPLPDVDRSRTRTILAVLVLATFVVILNETIMTNAIPRLMREFDVTASTAQWLSTVFMLTMAVVIPASGWLMERLATRRTFALAMVLFSIGTAACLGAPTFAVLIGGRVVQACGTAIMMPLLMTTLMNLVPAHERGKVMGNVTLVISVAPAMGPAVSGVLLQLGSWRLIFAVVLPIAIGALVVGLRSLVDVAEPGHSDLDLPSLALSAVGFGGLVYGLSGFGEGASHGGASSGLPPWAFVVVGLVAMAVFTRRQLALQRNGTPLLDLRTLSHRTFTIGLVLMVLCFMGLMGTVILLPIYLQEVRGMSSLSTGLLMIPGGLAMGLLGPQVGKAYDRYGAPRLVVPGAAGLVAGLVMLALLAPVVAPWGVLVLHVLISVSLALVFTPVFTASLGVLPPHLYPHGSAILGSLQQVGAAAGTATTVAVMAFMTARASSGGASANDALMSGVQGGFAVGAVLAVLALGAATLVRTPRP